MKRSSIEPWPARHWARFRGGDRAAFVLLACLLLPACAARRVELAGNALPISPHFEYPLAFNEGDDVQVALAADLSLSADLYVVANKSQAQWRSDRSLVDVRGAPQPVNFPGGTVPANTVIVTGGSTLPAATGLDLGQGYDLVLDKNTNGKLDRKDYIDGRGDESGFWVVRDTTQSGPLAVTELTYNVPGWSGAFGFAGENLFYPSNVATMGALPLIVVSHGNGHNYQWYDHLGQHMASYGYILMSHANNTGPGVLSAATTTLEHTDAFLGNLATIAGGALVGHVDASRIVWIGHSRGGEGVVIAYDRIVDGGYAPSNFSLPNIRLVSSIAPTDFEESLNTDPHFVNYHLWTGAGDSDVNGCASCNLCQTFHLHDRAQQYRQSVSLYGAGHGDFHNGGGFPYFTGPCPIGTPDTHKIVKGYLLPLIEHYVEGNVPSRDYLTRQWESFRPSGAPIGACVAVNLTYRAGVASGKFVIDDYQSAPSAGQSSSGGSVSFTVTGLSEDRLDDSNSNFTTGLGTMDGMTVGGTGDDTRGVVFEWAADANYELEIIPAQRDLSPAAYVSFRAAQETRHANTAPAGDLTFTVTLVDGNGVTSDIAIAAYSGGIEAPYQRTSCGVGAGWANEFETIRIRVGDFVNSNSGIDLSDIVALRLNFGPSWGTATGRIGLDDVEIVPGS